ncbi:MAG TPA: hypothetical protein VFS62_18135 [Chloroflexota bacterium]|jgi:hypothetical protein|nr:hypothetical protein [Chloroflexota bacterium]
MNKAVVGTFPDSVSASRAINDLKASGFPGETINHVVREDMARDRRLPGPNLMPGMELLKGLIVGAVVGAIIGGVAWFFGFTAAWPAMLAATSALYSTVILMAIAGAICGLIEGCFAAAPLARARRALMMRSRADAMVSVHTDEAHISQAGDIMSKAGAWDVRRGAGSVMDEYRTVDTVQPETYGTTQLVTREEVSAPAAEGEPMAASQPDNSNGAALG